jgi:hypothetical protein
MAFTITRGFLQKCSSWEMGILTLAAAFFFSWPIFATWQQRETQCTHANCFCQKIGPKSPDFEGFFFSSSAIAIFRQAVCQNVTGFYIFILSSLIYSKIWLIPFVHTSPDQGEKKKNLVLLCCFFNHRRQQIKGVWIDLIWFGWSTTSSKTPNVLPKHDMFHLYMYRLPNSVVVHP